MQGQIGVRPDGWENKGLDLVVNAEFLRLGTLDS